MRVTVVTEPERLGRENYEAAPWIYFATRLAMDGVQITLKYVSDKNAFSESCDVMLLYVWQDSGNPKRFQPYRYLSTIERLSAYRARFPDVVQVACNHTDMSRVPYVLSHWRLGDPVLYRTPARDRAELAPIPAEHIWPWEFIYDGRMGYMVPSQKEVTKAVFIGTPSGPDPDYRRRVAEMVAKVGVGVCSEHHLPLAEYHKIFGSAKICVCPRGWGEQSSRHWDTWKSKKVMLTDQDFDKTEAIPGQKVHRDTHYLVYDNPEDIPEIVDRWTSPEYSDRLARIAQNGFEAATSYDPYQNILRFFRQVLFVGKRSAIDQAK